MDMEHSGVLRPLMGGGSATKMSLFKIFCIWTDDIIVSEKGFRNDNIFCGHSNTNSSVLM